MGEMKQQPLWHSFVAGATSGLAARIVTFPADTLKARLQIKGALSGDVSQYRSTAAAAKHILTTEGAIGFFRGFGAVLWGVVPANLAYFGGQVEVYGCQPGRQHFSSLVCTGTQYTAVHLLNNTASALSA
jgi:hypothetical protein